ncbi:MAG: ABC transporter ATP-binding protein [Candidatus Heimdallarchaeota archaeon]|nr:MAG: ABC transporter ATP-binding protein [Candidatus Heimdallarchaeota archaeon]
MSQQKMIEVNDLVKIYHSKRRTGLFRSQKNEVEALRGVSFFVNQGEIFGLLGPNGAGKTTLIKILTTLLLPTSGTAKVNEFTLDQDKQVKASIGAMLMGERGLYWKLTGRENLEYFGALYHVPKKVRRERIDNLIDLLELEKIADRTVETYSSGQKMKMVFARALINNAPILMLDEPTNTLDVKEARRLRKIVKEHNESENKTIIYCTHQMYEAEELCHRVAIIDHGRIIALDDPEELKDGLEQSDILSIEGTIPEEARFAVNSLPGVTSANILVKRSNNGSTEEKPYLSVVCEDSRQILPDLISTLNIKGAIIRNIDKQETTLEDVFVNITGRSLMDDTRQSETSN